MDKNTVALFDYAGFRRKLYYRYLQFFKENLKLYELSQMEAELLILLLGFSDKNTASQMIEYRDLTKSQVSVCIDKLFKGGYLYREQGPGNRKEIHLYLTSKGRYAAEEFGRCKEQFLSWLYGNMTPEEAKTLGVLLDKISMNLSDIGNG